MPVTVTKKFILYQFQELTEAAKERARAWWREGDLDYEWWDGVYEQAEHAAEMLGIALSRKSKDTPSIYFSGFSSQGDGACWEGSYRYKAGALKAVMKEFPAEWTDQSGEYHYSEGNAELHRIAKGLQDLQRRHFYKLEADVYHRGHYYNSGCMRVDAGHADSHFRDIGNAEEDLSALLRDFADWIYRRLEEEYEYLQSDEVVDEAILANEYTFDEYGNREDG